MKTFIVAEIGVNHQGNINVTRRLIQGAKLAGVDSVKFQVFNCFNNLKKYEFTKAQWTEIFAYCREYKMPWFATPFDRDAVSFLDRQVMETWKIPSNSHVINDPFLLEQIAKTKNRKATIISTGIANDKDIQWLLQFFGNKPYILLHCVSEYPAAVKNLNLQRITHLKERFKCPVGFSDHSISITAPLEAVKLGACVIEKHITLNRDWDGPDHRSSLTPGEFKQMIQCIRRWEGK